MVEKLVSHSIKFFVLLNGSSDYGFLELFFFCFTSFGLTSHKFIMFYYFSIFCLIIAAILKKSYVITKKMDLGLTSRVLYYSQMFLLILGGILLVLHINDIPYFGEADLYMLFPHMITFMYWL